MTPACLTFCLTTACTVLAWTPATDNVAVAEYVIRVQGYEVARLPATACNFDTCRWTVPQDLTRPRTFA